MLVPQSDAREVVLAVATLVWVLLAGASVAALGRLLLPIGGEPSRAGRWIIAGGALTAVAVTFVLVAGVRASIGYYEPDLLGRGGFVAPALVATAVAVLGAELGRGIGARIWRVTAVGSAVATLLLAATSLAWPASPLPAGSAVALLAAISYAIAAAVWAASAVRAPSRSGVPAP